jgi:copper chaperone CopZ
MSASLFVATLTVSGMRSYGCCAAVSAALGRVLGVRDVSVSLLRARATVLHDGCEPAALLAAVAAAGYSAVHGEGSAVPGAH